MHILFDHNTPRQLRQHLGDGHSVTLARELAWNEKSNGDLIASADEAGFDLLITCDQSIQYQQNLTARKIAIIVLMPAHWKTLAPFVDRIKEAVEKAAQNSYQEFQFDDVKRNRRGP